MEWLNYKSLCIIGSLLVSSCVWHKQSVRNTKEQLSHIWNTDVTTTKVCEGDIIQTLHWTQYIANGQNHLNGCSNTAIATIKTHYTNMKETENGVSEWFADQYPLRGFIIEKFARWQNFFVPQMKNYINKQLIGTWYHASLLSQDTSDELWCDIIDKGWSILMAIHGKSWYPHRVLVIWYHDTWSWIEYDLMSSSRVQHDDQWVEMCYGLWYSFQRESSELYRIQSSQLRDLHTHLLYGTPRSWKKNVRLIGVMRD
jgi:hypothetical protein